MVAGIATAAASDVVATTLLIRTDLTLAVCAPQTFVLAVVGTN
jgi:hypothetical protein